MKNWHYRCNNWELNNEFKFYKTMFKGIFDDSFMDEVKGFIDYLGDVFEGFDDVFGDTDKNEDCQTKRNGEPESHEHSHTYCKEETRVNGELVEQREEEWQDGEKVKDEHYTKELGCGQHCKCTNTERKTNGDVEYTIEFDDEDAADTPDERAESKSDVLRKCVNSLCEDAKKDHDKISELEMENNMLRDELNNVELKHKQHVADLLEEIDKLTSELKEKEELISAFSHLTDAVHKYDSKKN